MKNYKAIITDKTSSLNGQVVANTKSSMKYRGMSKGEFIEATKYVCVDPIMIVEI